MVNAQASILIALLKNSKGLTLPQVSVLTRIKPSEVKSILDNLIKTQVVYKNGRLYRLGVFGKRI